MSRASSSSPSGSAEPPPESCASTCAAARRVRSLENSAATSISVSAARPADGRGQALGEERALGAPRGVQRRLRQRRSTLRRAVAAGPGLLRSRPRSLRQPRRHERRRELGAVGHEADQLLAHRARREVAEHRAQLLDDGVLALGARQIRGGQHALDAEAHERHRRLDALAPSRRRPRPQRDRPDRCPRAAARRAARACAAPRRARARSIASCPALSASSASRTVGASRASSPTCSSVSAVPISPTVLRSPAWCSAMTSV